MADIPATVHKDLKVEPALLLSGLERGMEFTLENFEPAILLGVLAIDLNTALAFLEADAGCGALAAADGGEDRVVSGGFHVCLERVQISRGWGC